MNLPQTIYACVLFGSLLFPSWLLGSYLLHRPRVLPAPRLTRFLVGFCLGPFVLPLIVFITAGVLPGAHKLVFLAIPSLLCVLAVVRARPNVTRPLLAITRKHWRGNELQIPTLLIYLCLVVVAACVTSILWTNAQFLIYGDDALKYMQEALSFAERRDWASLPRFDGALGGNTASSAHSPAYQLLLAFALLCTPAEQLGYPNDQAARLVAQILICYLGLSIVALGQYVKQQGAGALALVMTCTAIAYWGFSFAHTRDAFRMVALVCFVATLLPLVHRRCSPAHGLLLAAVTCAAALSHVVDVLSVALICVAFALYMLRTGHLRRAATALSWVGVGGVVGCAQTFANLKLTGHLMGSVPSRGFQNTPLWDALMSNVRFSAAAQMSIWDRFDAVFRGQGPWLSIAGLSAGIVVSLMLLARRPTGSQQHAALLALSIVALYLPLSGLLDGLSVLPISYLMSTNMRYLAHVHPLASVLLVYLLFRFVKRADSSARLATSLLCSAIVLASTVLAVKVVNQRWVVMTEQRQSNLLAQLDVINAAVQDNPGTLVIDQDFLRYYLRSRTAYLGYVQLWPLLNPVDSPPVTSLLRRLGVSAVLLDDRKVNSLWKHINLVDRLTSANDIEHRRLSSGMSLYVLTPEHCAATRLLVLLDQNADQRVELSEIPKIYRSQLLSVLDADANSVLTMDEFERIGSGFRAVEALGGEMFESTRSGVRVMTNLRYQDSHSGEPWHQLDVYLPHGVSQFPTLLLLHGGGLRAGSKKEFQRLGIELAKAGIASAAINYRLSPQFMHPAQVQDSAAAFAWLKENIGLYDGDAQRIGLLGVSAGGYLAMLLSSDPQWLAAEGSSIDDVRAVIGISSLVDVSKLSSLRQAMTWREQWPALRDASPLTHAGAHNPPTLLLVGSEASAVEIRQNRLFAEKLNSAPAEFASMMLLSERTHSSVLPGLNEANDPGAQAIRVFLDRYLH